MNHASVPHVAAPGSTPAVADAVQARRSAGSARRSAPIQAKLAVGPAGDVYEQEADRVAAEVMREIRSRAAGGDGESFDGEHNDRVQPMLRGDSNTEAPGASGLTAGHPDTPTGRIQAKRAGPAIGTAGGALDADTDSRIRRASGTGKPLDADIRQTMERGFGADFSQVRVHDNATADDLNQRIQARAFTTGPDIFFAQGQFQPSTSGGQELLAHELTHVVQQGGAATEQINRMTEIAEGISHGPVQIQRSGEKIGGGIAELYVPDTATKTVSFFGHGVANGDIAAIDGASLGYYCPHQSALNSNLSMMELATLYSADLHGTDGQWHNYTLTPAHIGLSDEQAKENCNKNGSALAIIAAPTSTADIVKALLAKGFTTFKAIHCREVLNADNKEWDPVTNSEVEQAATTQTVTRASLTGKWDYEADGLITDQTKIEADFVYMEAEEDWGTAKRVVEVSGQSLEITTYP